MTPKSIGILTGGLGGGAFANLSAALVKGFHGLGVGTLYLIHLSDLPGNDLELPDSVQVVPLGARRSLRAPLALARLLRGSKPEVLISLQAFLNIAAIVGRALAGQATTRLIISEHATMSHEILVEHRGSMKFMVLPCLMRLLYPCADGLAATSPGVLQDLLQNIRVPLDARRTQVIPNPVDLDRIRKLSREPVDHPWLSTRDSPVILSVGRLAREKNRPLLLKAFARLTKTLRARLLIMGEGPERERLLALARQLGIQDQVQFLGYMRNPYGLMARSDLFVLSSELEAFGMVLVEAMACGVPVVATDAIGGGPRGILDGGRYGALVPRGDEIALASVLAELLGSGEARRDRVAAGMLRCRDYSPEAVAGQWLSLMERV